ncbi:MAG: tetratricopeptide repeat protein, partial [bacterium]
WNMHVYTGDKVDDVFYRGLWDVFNYGLSYFDRYQKPLTRDEKQVAEAFAYFNKYVNRAQIKSDFNKTFRKIRDGRHPVANEAFVKIGSYMAAQLQEKFGTPRRETYHKMGAITFFKDYLELCQQNPDYPVALRFTEQFEKTVTEWNLDWQKTCTDYTRRLAITPSSNIEKIGNELKKTFSNARVYPDFSQEFADVIRYFYIKGDQKQTFTAANLALELYPQSTLPEVLMANAYVCFGEKEKARKLYKKTLASHQGDWNISAFSLNRYAKELANFGKLDEAAELLQVAIELFPRAARLYDSLAEIHLKRGKNYYQKALQLDATFEPARQSLKKLP